MGLRMVMTAEVLEIVNNCEDIVATATYDHKQGHYVLRDAEQLQDTLTPDQLAYVRKAMEYADEWTTLLQGCS